MNKQIFILLTLLTASLLLVGCKNGLGLPNQETSFSPEKMVCDDPLGCVEVTAGAPIRIASAGVTSGPNESLGVDSRNGVEIALEDYGDIMGFPVELQSEDSGCSAEGGQTVAQKLASDNTIVGIIGHSCSSSCTPAAPIYDAAGMVMISPSCTAPSLTGENHLPSFLRTAHNDITQGRVMAEYVFNDLGLTSAATVHDGSPYAEQLQQVFADVFTELGGEITAQEAINVGDTDMRPVLNSIAATSPELLYYPILIAEGGFLTIQAKETTGLEDIQLVVADSMLSSDFVVVAGDASEGIKLTGPDISFADETYSKLLIRYKEKFGGSPPAAFHAHAYDATGMLLSAIEAVAKVDSDGTMFIGRQAIRDVLYADASYHGITGDLVCNENGDCANQKIVVNEIKNGNFVSVK